MKSASKLFSVDQKQQINDAVCQAELGTSGEIVPVVVTMSGRYDRPEDIVGLWVGAIVLVVVWAFLPQPAETGSWGGLPVWLNPALLVATVIVGFIVGAFLASRIGWLRRLFTSRTEMRDEVAARSAQVFAESGIYKTENATGILIYVSLYERMAVVRGDDTVLEKIGQESLDEICSELIELLHAGDPTGAFCRTIENVGEKLALVLPRPASDTDELPNELMIID